MSQATLTARLHFLGESNNERIKRQKLRSLRSALRNDYNSRLIKTPELKCMHCLINEDNLKSDYDYKWLSVEYKSHLKPGDVFEVLDNHTHWMVYRQDILEISYLRAQIVCCEHILDIDGRKYWIYFQGPTETDLRWFQKQGINYNELNLSGTIYITKDEHTLNFFKRFTKIEIEGHKWEVQVTDSITVPGIIELEIQEYYDDAYADLPKIEKISSREIVGPDLVKQDTIVGYEIQPEFYNPKYRWQITDNERVKIHEVMQDGRICKVRVHQGAIKEFKVHYGPEYETRVFIDISDPVIQGPQTVYPFDIHTYFIPDMGKIEFSIDNPALAKIIDSNENSIKVEILSGKKGQFNIKAIVAADDTEYFLPVTIGSF